MSLTVGTVRKMEKKQNAWRSWRLDKIRIAAGTKTLRI